MGTATLEAAFIFQMTKWHEEMYSMPQRVGHASLDNLEVLYQKANDSTIAFTHCEQENEIT